MQFLVEISLLSQFGKRALVPNNISHCMTIATYCRHDTKVVMILYLKDFSDMIMIRARYMQIYGSLAVANDLVG